MQNLGTGRLLVLPCIDKFKQFEETKSLEMASSIFSHSPRKCSWLTCGKADESSQNQLTHLSSFAREVDGLETKLSHNRDGNQKSNK